MEMQLVKGWFGKITMAREVQMNCRLPAFYGVAYAEYFCDFVVAYPVPLNLIVRFFRNLWHEAIRHRPTKLDDMLREAYCQGILFRAKELNKKIVFIELPSDISLSEVERLQAFLEQNVVFHNNSYQKQ